MTKQINKKGFTLAEALIAMLLVAVMAAGIITALMATKRSIIAPSNREEMIFAIEEATSLLQAEGSICGISNETKLNLTPNCTDLSNPNDIDCRNISCLLPRACSDNSDFFVYSVSEPSNNDGDMQGQRVIRFRIQCEGQTI